MCSYNFLPFYHTPIFAHTSLIQRSFQYILNLEYIFQCLRIRQPANFDGRCQEYSNRAVHVIFLIGTSISPSNVVLFQARIELCGHRDNIIPE